MASKHMDAIEEACKNNWKMLETLNTSFKGTADDAKQYHDIVASLYKLKGLEMLEESQEQTGEQSFRGGTYGGGNSYRYWDPVMHGGGLYDRDDYGNGTSGARYRTRDARGRYTRNASYHSHDEMIEELRDKMREATPDIKRAYRQVISDMESE